MRMIVIRQGTDLQSLGARLLSASEGRDAALEQLQRLNPHVDFKRIEPGTVLLVPDLPGLREGETSSVGGQAFEAFHEQLTGSLDAAITRVRRGHEALVQQRQEVNAVLKTASVKRLLEADPDIKPQLAAAAQVFKQDQQQAKDADKMLDSLQQNAAAELASLAKLLG